MKSFNVPVIYRSPLITAIKNKRKEADKLKKDFSPTLLDFGGLQIYLARHFGFCYGVENAIEISFRAVEENPDKRIFLLSEMIHNPQVNDDLLKRGVQFLMDTNGQQLISWDQLTASDIVIIPAFGTTLEIEKKIASIGISPIQYNTTCPFVERVWNKAAQIGETGYTVVIHGKPKHEETRATFSHSQSNAASVIVYDMKEAEKLALYITGKKSKEEFYIDFKGQYSEGFDVSKDLEKIGVVNQTTMLATDTQAIADYLKGIMKEKNNASDEELPAFFAETRDTLCYATNDNQSAVRHLLHQEADLAIVVGGYNSSNTSHLVELCELQLPTYYISSEEEIISGTEIHHWNFHQKIKVSTLNFLPTEKPVKILITSGASCPDALVEGVIRRLTSLFSDSLSIEAIEGNLFN
jgi:4-hydroxy-3-methylbut-2-en-1-yl diphosphate reductase